MSPQVGESGAPSGPATPRPPAATDTMVVRAAIHPAIGIARAATARAGISSARRSSSRARRTRASIVDEAGALKRQAARFRVYGYNAAGQAVRELTADRAHVRWTVHVANKKAAWYQWQMALDVPEAAAIQVPRRNAGVKGEDRRGLVIDGGPRSVEGRDTRGSEYEFRRAVPGDRRLPGRDPDRRRGAAPVPGWPRRLGLAERDPDLQPVRPERVHQRRRLVRRHVRRHGHRRGDPRRPPDPGRAGVGGHRAAQLRADAEGRADALRPALRPQRLGRSLPLPAGGLLPRRRLPDPPPPQRPPVVEPGLRGPVRPGEALRLRGAEVRGEARVEARAGERDTYAELRLQVLHAFRIPGGGQQSAPLAVDLRRRDGRPPADTPRQNARLSPTQYAQLTAWAAATFVDDWRDGADPRAGSRRCPSPSSRRCSTARRWSSAWRTPSTRAARSPGRSGTSTMFAAPFRIRHRPTGTSEPDYGTVLDPSRGPCRRRAALRPGAGRPDAVDGAALAGGHGLLPLGLLAPGYTYDPYIPPSGRPASRTRC